MMLRLLSGLLLCVTLAVAGHVPASPLSTAFAAKGGNLGLLTPGVLTYGSDTTYPPMEYADPNHPGTFIGADVELASAIAKAMGLKRAKIISAPFDSLITSLQARRFDVIISSMNDTPLRRKIINYVDYMKAAEGILLPASSKVKANSYTGLCGMSVAAEKGTTEQYGLEAANKTCAKKINILGYTADTDAFQAFYAGHAQAYTTDLPVVIHYIKTYPGKFREAGKPIILTNYGIGVRKSSRALQAAVQKAVNTIIANGRYRAILKKWGLSAAALKK